MAAVLTYNLTINKGATYRQKFTWRSGPDSNNLTAVDNTGFTARMQVRESFESATAIIDLTTSANANGDVITLGGVNGEIEIFISDETTTAVTIDGGVYDLELEAPAGGDVTRVLQGTVVFDPEVTQ